MSDLQFYPTPLALAKKAWDKFESKDFTRILEPSAGQGHFLNALPEHSYLHRNGFIDVIEIDASHHATLREKGLRIVGYDFLQFEAGSQYSHICMNPPFAYGAQHALHAYDILYSGEVVAILNAETIRNPYSHDRQRLVRLIEECGSVEFVKDAFKVEQFEDVVREADVDAAIVHLRKVADESAFDAVLTKDILGSMKKDRAEEGFGAGKANLGEGELILPNSFVQNSVLAFDAAVVAMKESLVTEARAANFAERLGKTLVEEIKLREAAEEHPDATKNTGAPKRRLGTGATWVRAQMGVRYLDLKDRAWSAILRSALVSDKLSSKAQRRIESEFETIKQLEYTESNIHGFLLGLAQAGSEIQIQMAVDVFDLFTRYVSDNTVFYKGWVSNDAHRTCAYRIKTTRMILPGYSHNGWSRGFSYDGLRLLADFDKVFAMLDGVTPPANGLENLFRKHFEELKQKKRLTSAYFDVRYHSGVGTIHFFPTRPDLIERLNRLVGQHRKWLPENMAEASEDFLKQYTSAEKFDAEIRKEFASQAGQTSYSHYYNFGIKCLVNPTANPRELDERYKEAVACMDRASTVVLERKGINVQAMLTSASSGGAHAARPQLSAPMLSLPLFPVESQSAVCI